MAYAGLQGRKETCLLNYLLPNKCVVLLASSKIGRLGATGSTPSGEETSLHLKRKLQRTSRADVRLADKCAPHAMEVEVCHGWAI